MMPFWRAFFAIFWAYGCFSEVKDSAQDAEISESLSIGLLTLFFVAMNIVSWLPDPYWLLSLFTFICLIPVNNLAIKINQKNTPKKLSNDKFSVLNWVALVLGGLMLVLLLLGLFLSVETAQIN